MLDNKLGLYFPQMIQQLGWILLVFGILALVKAVPMPTLIVPIGLIGLGLVFSLTVKGIRLDFQNRKIKHYMGLFGISFGSWKPLPQLTEIVFTSANYSQQIHAIVSRRTLHTKEFRAFIKGTDSKILISTGRNAQEVKQDVHQVAEQLHLPAVDYTQRPPVKIH